jgi:hypothetical protein
VTVLFPRALRVFTGAFNNPAIGVPERPLFAKIGLGERASVVAVGAADQSHFLGEEREAVRV